MSAITHVPVSDVRFEETRYAGREGDRFQTAAWLDSSHPAILTDNRWEGVKFYQAIRVAPGDARVVARLSDQTPLLLDQQVGQGRILIFTSTFDNIANDFPLHASFVPFVEQTARYLGRLDAGPAGVTVGSFAELRDTKAKGAAGINLAGICCTSNEILMRFGIPPAPRIFNSPSPVSTRFTGPPGLRRWQ